MGRAYCPESASLVFSKQDFGENVLLLFALACDTLFLARMSSGHRLGELYPVGKKLADVLVLDIVRSLELCCH